MQYIFELIQLIGVLVVAAIALAFVPILGQLQFCKERKKGS
ncbi:hypothetical protein SPONL_2029 [uncultured Candidatus Thioglobus sp.]|nr:hypothetical protein SPONL_2029 [uncultured Candidatus Thioglobus sp.]